MAGSGAGASGRGKCRGLKVSDENRDRSTGRSMRGGGRRETEEKGLSRYRSEFHGRKSVSATVMKRLSGQWGEGFRSEGGDEERKTVLKP